jgi:hypothetical protein
MCQIESSNFKSVGLCPICERDMVVGKRIDRHHLIPKCKKGKETVWLHQICHQKIHSIWTENELVKEYHVIESIIAHPEIIKFISWIKNKPIDFYDSNHDTNTRSKRRKRKK